MDFLIYIIIVTLTTIVCSFIFSMIILSAFFGIPQTKKLKKEKILLDSASITPYLITIFIWVTITFTILLFLFNRFKNDYFIAVIVGMLIALFNSFKSLSNDNYQINMEALLKKHSNNINPNFVNFVSNGINDICIKKANEIAQSRGFNNWDELESAFLVQNNITLEPNMNIEQRLNFVANYQGFDNFDELYIASMNEPLNSNNNSLDENIKVPNRINNEIEK